MEVCFQRSILTAKTARSIARKEMRPEKGSEDWCGGLGGSLPRKRAAVLLCFRRTYDTKCLTLFKIIF